MTGSALSLGVEGGKSHCEAVSQPHLSPLRKPPLLLNETKNKSTLRMSEKTWESRRIKEEIQDILSPTPLELHKVDKLLNILHWTHCLTVLCIPFRKDDEFHFLLRCWSIWLVLVTAWRIRTAFSGLLRKCPWESTWRFICNCWLISCVLFFCGLTGNLDIFSPKLKCVFTEVASCHFNAVSHDQSFMM